MVEERYSRLYTTGKNMYSEGSPLLICAGALLKDNRNGKVIAQLKFKNVTGKVVKGVKIKLRTFDTFGKELDVTDEYQYKDLYVKRNDVFGEQNAIPLSDDNSRKMDITIESVLFGDSSVWEAVEQEWKEVELGKKTSEVYVDEELVKQFKLELGTRAEYVFTQGDFYWNCVCGNFNTKNEVVCSMCGIKKSKILETSMESVIEKRDIRVREEKANKEKEDRIKKEKDAEEKAKKEKAISRAIKIAVAVIVTVGLVFGGIVLNSSVLRPRRLYNQALEHIQNGQYEEGYQILEELGNYSDAAEQINIGKYNQALALIEAEQYEDGYIILRKLGNYSDSAEQIKIGKYNQALKLLETGQYDDGYAILKELGNYSDAEDQINNNILERVDMALENDEYEEAINLLAQSTLSDVGTRTKEVKYLQAKHYIETNYKRDAIYILKDLYYKDSNDLFHEVCYDYASSLLDTGQYEMAMSFFAKIENYLDSNEKLKEAKYGYVVSNQDSSFSYNYYECLLELKNENYKDSASIYRKLYTPSVKICVNQTSGNDRDALSTVHASQPIYFHYEFDGLIPKTGEKGITFKLQDGASVSTGTLTGIGKIGYVEAGYSFFYGSSTTLRCTFYDVNGNVIGSKAVTVVP